MDKSIRGKILGLRVHCSENGCDWEGELGDLKQHTKKCAYIADRCPHGCGQSYPRHILQTHQLNECPCRPVTVQLESMQRQFSQKYELLHTQLQEIQQKLVQQEKKHKEDKQELQQQLIQQEKKHEEGMKALQQQLLRKPEKNEEQQQQMEERDTGSPDEELTEQKNELDIPEEKTLIDGRII